MIGGSVERQHLLLIDSDVVAYYKKSPKLFKLSPIEDFASVVERQTAATYFLVFVGEIASQFSSYISYNYTPQDRKSVV